MLAIDISVTIGLRPCIVTIGPVPELAIGDVLRTAATPRSTS
jgi:hypothetical protein